MRIPKEAITDAYKYAKEAYEETISSNEYAQKLHSKHHIKVSSAKDYYYYFRYLMTGSGSCRSLSSYTQEYFLKRIYEDFGKAQLKKSLNAFQLLIEKFEGEDIGSKKTMRAIYKKYSNEVYQ